MLCKKILQSYNCRSVGFQKFSTALNVDKPVLKKVKKSPSSKVAVSEDVVNHLKENNLEHYMNFIPKKLLKKSSTKKHQLYLTNRDGAKEFCSLIADDLLKNTSHVIENNPGLGFLTESLLNAGVPTIHLYEKNALFLESGSPLLSLYKKYTDRLKLKDLDFTEMWTAAIRDKYQNENLTSSYLNDAPYFDWKDKPYAQIILFVPDRQSVALLVYNFFNQTHLFTHGRPTLYLAVQAAVWKRLSMFHEEDKQKRFYQPHNIMLNCFFNWQYFGELPRKSFIPWTVSTKKTPVNSMDVSMIVIKLEPKKDAFKILEAENIKPFWYWLKYCMKSKKSKVIHQLEKLVPGSGAKLIKENINITTNFKDLPPERILDIFKIFRALPEYDESGFMPNAGLSEDKHDEEEKIEGEEKPSQEPTSQSETAL